MRLEELVEQFVSQGATELHLRTGQPPAFRTERGIQPLPGGALTAQQMRGLIEGTELLGWVRKAGPDGVRGTVSLFGRQLGVLVVRRGVQVDIRLSSAAPPKTGAKRPSSAPLGRKQLGQPRARIPTPEPERRVRETGSHGSRQQRAKPAQPVVPKPTPQVAPAQRTPAQQPARRRDQPTPLPSIFDQVKAQTSQPRPVKLARTEPAPPPEPRQRPVVADSFDLDQVEVEDTQVRPPPAGLDLPDPAPAPELKPEREPDPEPQPSREPFEAPSAPRERKTISAIGISARDRGARLKDPTHPKLRVLERPVDPALIGHLRQARNDGASDVHVGTGRPVMIRRAGRLLPTGQPLDESAADRTLLPLLDKAQFGLLHERGYVDLALELEHAGRLRVNVSRHRGGLRGTFRLVADAPKSLDALGLPAELAKVTSYHLGLVIISGPSGHGKTTTMASIVDQLNRERAWHIITLEDPVEVIHTRKKALISQREIGSHTASYARALKAALREDPDVIVIGELRDTETVEMALTAAETGHLVIATMSTPSAGKTIDALIDLVPPADQAQARAMLAGALKFVVSQRLLPTRDGQRLVPAAELLVGCVPLWSLIREQKLHQLPGLMQRGKAFGMIRFDESLRRLYEAGEISEGVAIANAHHPQSFTRPAERPSPTTSAQRPSGAGQDATRGQSAPEEDKKGGLASKVGGLFRRKGK